MDSSLGQAGKGDGTEDRRDVLGGVAAVLVNRFLLDTGEVLDSLTVADRRAPSAFPAAIAVAAFITCPICRMLGRSPMPSTTRAIAVSATSATSA